MIELNPLCLTWILLKSWPLSLKRVSKSTILQGVLTFFLLSLVLTFDRLISPAYSTRRSFLPAFLSGSPPMPPSPEPKIELVQVYPKCSSGTRTVFHTDSFGSTRVPTSKPLPIKYLKSTEP